MNVTKPPCPFCGSRNVNNTTTQETAAWGIVTHQCRDCAEDFSTPIPEDPLRVLVTTAKKALAVLEDEADRRGDTDGRYDFPATPAATELRTALEFYQSFQ